MMRYCALKSILLALCLCHAANSVTDAQLKQDVKIIRRPATSPSGGHSNEGSYHGNHGHRGRGYGHHHHYPGFTPYIGFYPGTGGYWGGGFYGSSYSQVYSPFGGSFFYGTYAPGVDVYYGPNWGPAVYSQPYPFPYSVPQAPMNSTLLDQQRVAEQFRQDALERKQRQIPKPALDEPVEIPLKPLKASSTKQQLRSQRLKIAGDDLFRKHNQKAAVQTYRDANFAAPDLPAPYFRLGIALAMEGKFESAIAYLKRTLEIAPNWPTSGDALKSMLGDDDTILRNTLLIKVSRWVEQDLRDPDRSLLMGVMLFEYDREKSLAFLETSARLSGDEKYAGPYLNAQPNLTDRATSSEERGLESPQEKDISVTEQEPDIPRQSVPPRPPDPRPENNPAQPLEGPRFPSLPK